jgi:hypothetical protein
MVATGWLGWATGQVEASGQNFGEKAAALLFVRVPAAEMDTFRERLDRIIETVRIP